MGGRSQVLLGTGWIKFKVHMHFCGVRFNPTAVHFGDNSLPFLRIPTHGP